MKLKKSTGFSLIELVIAIIMVGIGVAGFTQLFNTSTINSVDPMIQQQANAIARAYLEEISLRSFCDPDLSTDCPTFCSSGFICTNCSSSGGESRSTYDDVCDYDGLSDSGAYDQSAGAVITGLENYNVDVTVDDGSDGTAAVLGALSSASQEVLRIDVNVTHATNTDIGVTVSGYRTNY